MYGNEIWVGFKHVCSIWCWRAPSHPCVVANQLLALFTGVGEKAVIAGDAVGAVFRLDVLAAIQGLLAVVTVEAIGHGCTLEDINNGYSPLRRGNFC